MEIKFGYERRGTNLYMRHASDELKISDSFKGKGPSLNRT